MGLGIQKWLDLGKVESLPPLCYINPPYRSCPTAHLCRKHRYRYLIWTHDSTCRVLRSNEFVPNTGEVRFQFSVLWDFSIIVEGPVCRGFLLIVTKGSFGHRDYSQPALVLRSIPVASQGAESKGACAPPGPQAQVLVPGQHLEATGLRGNH